MTPRVPPADIFSQPKHVFQYTTAAGAAAELVFFVEAGAPVPEIGAVLDAGGETPALKVVAAARDGADVLISAEITS